ncbi:hypothetical protein L1987_78219 [Smallanthus sonchifolius]|uniref:Uncharacterized protein n=1 Tax=Smallanthus sonchifolius TaxID=185202 RepID=A0ACB8ZB43_9ASTR|nr:hypothetical protein L1987_78219 [Smallanthus sonchifolius]
MRKSTVEIAAASFKHGQVAFVGSLAEFYETQAQCGCERKQQKNMSKLFSNWTVVNDFKDNCCKFCLRFVQWAGFFVRSSFKTLIVGQI